MAPHATDLHRVYLQTLLSRRVMREEVGRELYKRAISAVSNYDDTFRATHDSSSQGFLAFISDLSLILEQFGMQVKIERDETAKARQWVVLVNTDANSISELATDLTATEITYLRMVIKEIVESYPANSIGSTRAMRLASNEAVKMTKIAAESLLESMVSRGWLAKSKRGRFSLATRGLQELEPYLMNNYEDLIRKCQRCHRIVMTGMACPNDECSGHWHLACFAAARNISRNACSVCKTSFVTDEPRHIGEKAVSRVEDTFHGENRKRRRSSRRGPDDSLLEDEEDELEDEEGIDSQEQSQSQSVDHSAVDLSSSGPPDSARWAAESSDRPRRKRASVIPETQLDD